MRKRVCENSTNDQLKTTKELMKKTFLIMICVLTLSSAVPAGRYRPLANEGKNGLYVKSIEQVLRLEEDEVDLATAALIISENWSDLVHGRRHLSALDDMALEIRDRLDKEHLGMDYQAIAVINKYLFDELGFESIPEANDPNDLFLHTVLDKKRGYCLSLSILYLSIGERLGLPLYGVVAPGHFFIRYDDKQVRFNIETTSKGGNAPDEHYIDKFKVPEGDNESIYMKNLNKIQTLGCFFNNLGNVYEDIGNTDSALLALERAVEINPTLSESRSNLANIYLKTGRVQEAISEYLAALSINPNDAKTYNNLGNAYTQQGLLNKAIPQYQQSLALEPNFIDAYKNLALAYCKERSFMPAITQLKQAVSLEPKDASLYSQIGDVYSQMENYEEAISQYKKALQIKQDLIETYCSLAFCYNKLGLADDEIQAYESALAIKPDFLPALINLGNAYFGKQNYDAAIEQYEKAVQIKPDESMFYYNLGSAYSNKQLYEQAVAAYLKAVEIEPDIGDAHFGLAFGFYQLKKYELAYKHIKIAQELGVNVTEDQLNAIKSRLK